MSNVNVTLVDDRRKAQGESSEPFRSERDVKGAAMREVCGERGET